MYRTEELPAAGRSQWRRELPKGGLERMFRRPTPLDWLPPRERQLAQLVHARQSVTATELCEALGAAISNAAVRSMLARLEKKGVVQRCKQGRKFLYMPAHPSQEAALAALGQLVTRHFNGSAMDAALALLGMAPAGDAQQADAIHRLSKLLRQVELD